MKNDTTRQVRASNAVAARLPSLAARYLVLTLLLSVVFAQVRPDISFNALRFSAGEVLELNGSGLSPNSIYDLTLSSPDGSSSDTQLTASAAGTTAFEATLDVPGRWELELVGEGLDALFRFQVAEPDPADTASTDTAPQETAVAPLPAQDEDATPGEANEATGVAVSEEALEATDDAPDAAPNSQQDADNTQPGAETADTEADAIPTDVPDAQTPDAETTGAEAVTAEDSTAQEELAAGPVIEAEDTPEVADTVEAADNSSTSGPETGQAEAPATDLSAETNTPDVADTATPNTATPNTMSDAQGATNMFESLFGAVAGVGWYSVIAMLVAIVALHITLVFKYWIPQNVMMRRQAASTKSSPLARFFAMRYYTFTEKLVLIIMLAATLLLASLAGWSSPNSSFAGWQDAVTRTFSNPWTGLQLDRPAGIHPFIWMFFIALFLLWAAITVLYLFVPRPRLAKNAPRFWMYNLFSVLIPGTGLADEMWGLLLIVPWALIGIDTLATLYGWGVGINRLSLRWDYVTLIVIYLINLAAVIVEFASYRRRMTKLKQANPELAEEFGLIR